MERNKNKMIVYVVLGVIALIVSAMMYITGMNNSNLTELLQYFWIPIPLGILLLVMAGKMK
jgi:uncharacterized membrane protein